MCDPESLNYYKLFKLLVDIGSKVLTQTIDNYCSGNSMTFEQMLNQNENKHILFHLWQQSSCCQCQNLNMHADSWNKNRPSILNKAQWQDLYEARNPPVNDHIIRGSNGQICLCKYSPIAEIQPKSLDLTLASCIILNVCNTKLSPAQKADIDNLRKFRNIIVGHSKKTRIGCPDFIKYWKDIACTILCISQSHGSSDSIKQEIDDIWTLNFVSDELISKMLQAFKLNYAKDLCITEEFEKLRLTVADPLDTISSRLEKLAEKVEYLDEGIADRIKLLLDDLHSAANHDREEINSHLQIWQHQIEEEIRSLSKANIHEVARNGRTMEENCIACSKTEENIIDCTKIEIEEHRKRSFLPTRALNEGVRKLKAHGIVIYRGIGGSGKTSHSLELLKRAFEGDLLDQGKVKIMHLSSVHGVEKMIDPKNNTLLFLDDPFANSTGDTKNILQILWSLTCCGSVKLVMTMSSDTFQFNSKLFEDCDLIDNEYITDLSVGEFQLNFEEKKGLIELYARNNNIKIVRKQNMENIHSDKILDTAVQVKIFHKTVEKMAEITPVIGFPLCCKKFFTTRYYMRQGVRFIEQCTRYILEEIENLAESENEGDRKEFGLLLLMQLQGGRLSCEDINNPVASKVENDLGISFQPPLSSRAALKRLSKKNVIRPKEMSEIYHFSNIAYFDAVTLTCADLLPELLENIVLCSTSRTLYQVIKTDQYVKTPCDMVLKIPKRCNNILIDRFLFELKQKKFRKVLFHQAFSDKDFVCDFLARFTDEANRDVLNSKDEHGYSFFELALFLNMTELLELSKQYNVFI